MSLDKVRDYFENQYSQLKDSIATFAFNQDMKDLTESYVYKYLATSNIKDLEDMIESIQSKYFKSLCDMADCIKNACDRKYQKAEG